MARLTRSSPAIPIVVLLLGLLITATGAVYVRHTILAKDRLRFETATRDAVRTIDSHMESYVALLRSVRGMMGREPVTRDGFRHFIDSIDLPGNYAGVQGVGYSARVRPEEREALVARISRERGEDFRIWPEYDRDEYHAIVFLEPQDRRNVVAIGYDMSTDEIRREAMVTARDSGVAAMSGKVTLVQEIDGDKQPGFPIYLPVYEGGAIPARLADRRGKLLGFAYCAFRVGDLLESTEVGGPSAQVAFSAYDGAETKPGQLLYASHPRSDPAASRWAALDYVAVARHTWTLAFHTLPEFEEASDVHLVWLAAIGGLMVTALLFALSWSQMRARRAAERYAAQIRESQKKLAKETREARRARTEAETANRLKDQFLATVSHELRTPLNAIQGWSDLLLDDPEVGDDVRHGLEVIGRNVRAQSQLVEDLLDVSRIISGRLRLDIRETDVREVLETTLESVRPAAEAREIAVQEDYAADVPRLAADPARLQQIVWNLLSNAIKFSPRGGNVALRLEADDLHVRIAVEDDGQGIEPEFLPYVFNAFRQADASISRKHAGLGLGLSIVRHLVEMHGGTIEVASEGIGKGARFLVELPLRGAAKPDGPVSPTAVAVEAESAGQAVRGGSLDGLRVLVVDDEPDARELLRALLEKGGAEVLAAGSAEEAFRLFGHENPDAIVSDIGMPEKDGFDLIREIRKREGTASSAPAIALTAFSSERDRLAAMDSGFDAHLAKPVRAGELVAAIARLATAARWRRPG